MEEDDSEFMFMRFKWKWNEDNSSGAAPESVQRKAKHHKHIKRMHFDFPSGCSTSDTVRKQLKSDSDS